MLYISCGYKHQGSSSSLIYELMKDIYFINGFDNIKKLQFWIHASPDNLYENMCTPPLQKGQTLLVLRAMLCINQEDIVEMDVLKYLLP